MLPQCSLCISTYNWPEALQACLQTVLRQTVLPSEIIIADDGSGPATREVIEAFQQKSPVPVKHIWQPDDGFRLAQIRNKAFAAAAYPYIIQIDGDLLLHPHYIADHMRAARPGTFLSGSRVMLAEPLSRQMLAAQGLQYPSLLSRQVTKKYNGLRCSLLSVVQRYVARGPQYYRYVLGCNMSFWRQDLLRVNGYNENFTGWGKEDNDIAIRLINAGVKLRMLKFGGIVYHLHHPQSDAARLRENEEALSHSLSAKITYIEKGMHQYLKEF